MYRPIFVNTLRFWYGNALLNGLLIVTSLPIYVCSGSFARILRFDFVGVT